MKELGSGEVREVSGGVVGGMPQLNPETNQYEVVPYNGVGAPLYVQIGGHWAPTGTEPFIGPARL